ncbi:BatA (Bacteroides aerotolerance operon) [hydrothermal vent metagenome]|uniref:BatA (Bacteroides aerotolerance operon) n=1 Tax=hydrothermal vent metagenome TaxID=652676 RepID=A0A3B1DQZ3_9ZZZZ
MLNLLKWVTIVCTLIALSSPIKQSEIIHKKNDGIDIVLCLDTSGSMRQMGFNKQNYRQNRWDVVNGLVKDFIVKRKNDNIGLVVFGSSVMTASPLTYDKKAQIKILNNLKIGVVGENTALIDSIATGVNILSKRESKSRIIIALTDGEDTASVIPYKVVESMSKKHKIKIYTIGIGEPNQLLLSEISKKSGGKSFIANNKDHLEEIYKHINKLEKSDIEQNKIILKEYYFFYPLTLSFFSLLLFVFIKNKY